MRNPFRREGRGTAATATRAVDDQSPPQQRQLTQDELDALLPRAQFDRASADYRGHFEGLWTDRRDVSELIDRRLRAGQLSEADADLLRHWVDHGYVVLEGAVPPDVCDQLQADLSNAFENGDDRLRVLKPGEHFGEPLQAGTDMRGMRVNDVYVHFESARQALFADPIAHFLRLVFDSSPMLLQSLTFESGSRQGVHRTPHTSSSIRRSPWPRVGSPWKTSGKGPASSFTTTEAIGCRTSSSATLTSAGTRSAMGPTLMIGTSSSLSSAARPRACRSSDCWPAGEMY